MDPFFDDLDYDRPTPSNLWNFPPLPPDPLPISFLEEAAAIAAIEDGVNTAAPAPVAQRKEELRRGKWTVEEENYANKLISEFKAGTLPLAEGTTLRTFLSKLLQCDPMRISKKFVGNKCIGKQVFRKRPESEFMSPEDTAGNRAELAALETAYLNKLAATSTAKRPVNGTSSNSPWIVSATAPSLPSSIDNEEFPPYIPHGLPQDSTSLWNKTSNSDPQFPWSHPNSTDDIPPVFHSASTMNSFSSKRGLSSYHYDDSYDNYDQYSFPNQQQSYNAASGSSNGRAVDVSNTMRKNVSIENFLMLMDSGIIPPLGSDVLSNPIFDNDGVKIGTKRSSGNESYDRKQKSRFE